MKLNLDKLIKKEILITSAVVLFLSLLFIGFTRAIYRTISEGQTNNVVYGNLEIQMCTDTSCANIASNLGNIVGMTDNISFTSNMYPKTEAEAMLGTPYSFVVKNVGQYDAYVDLISEYNWASENVGSSLVTNYSGVMIAYKKAEDINYQIKELNQFTVATQLFKNISFASGESQIFNVLVWASEEASNEIIDKIFITKIKASGYYIPDDPNNLHDDLDNSLVNEETNYVDFDYTGNFQEFIAPKAGVYKIELWGAQGVSSTSKGAYTRGLIELAKKEKLYIYVGEGLHSTGNTMAFNNGIGSSGGGNGGGATDVRLTAGNWDDPYSLNSRIMVAAGSGSGTGNNTTLLGAAGGLTGYAGGGTQGGTQSNFGSSTYSTSQFGIANGGCTGGNGYYPGGGAVCANGAGGGSSYISGHAGCIAINAENDISNPRIIKNGCTSASASVTCSTHYSGKIFNETKMIDGAGYVWATIKGAKEAMPNPSGGFYNLGTGHSGNGYARITHMPNLVQHTITFILNGGTQSSNFTGSYYENEEYYVEPPFYPGYNFTGWTISNPTTSVANNVMTVGNTNAELTANWQKATYTITYTLKNGIATNPTTFMIDSTGFTLNNPTRSDCTFAGWTGSNGNVPNTAISIPTGSYGNRNYVANWRCETNYDSGSNYTVTLSPGKYQIELWGAGGSDTGKGGYTSGIINLSSNTTFYVYVGSNSTSHEGGYNGGGRAGDGVFNTGKGGAGATDLRYGGTEYANRIMVAGGGGGNNGNGAAGACAGGLTDCSGTATQTSGNALGVGGSGSHGHWNQIEYYGKFYAWVDESGGGSGGGFYGGSSRDHGSGAGGSSYISGHIGCVTHSSGKTFTNTIMIDGENYNWETERTGIADYPINIDSPNGLARITLID